MTPGLCDAGKPLDVVASAEVLAGQQSSLLVDDTLLVWCHLSERCTGGGAGRIDMILDNAGHELVADLCLAAWLLATKRASSVHLHVKRYAWFVSGTPTGGRTALSPPSRRWHARIRCHAGRRPLDSRAADRQRRR